MIKDIKELYKDFDKLPIFIILGFIIIFHTTLLLGDYSIAMNQLFGFLYNPQNSNAVEFIRHLLINLAFAGVVYRCCFKAKVAWSYYRKVDFESYWKDEEYKDAVLEGLKKSSKKVWRTDTFIFLTMLLRYFIDILKYYQKNLQEFIETILSETYLYFIISGFLIIAFVIITFFIKWERK